MLESAGHQVAEAASLVQTIRETTGGLHDVLILDSPIEGVCEYEVCRTIRPKSDLGIILLMRDDAKCNRIAALEAGADDYLAEPFVPAELLARIRALLRRVSHSGPRRPKLVLADRAVDLQSHEVLGPDDHVTHLTPKEFNVLRYLVSHVNKPVSNRKLASAVWGRDADGDFEYLRVIIGQLRRKLEPNPESPRYLVTDRAFGYRFRLPVTDGVTRTPADSPAPEVQTGIQAMVQ